MATSETLSASASVPSRSEPDPGDVRSLTSLRRGLWLFVLAAGAGAVAMTLANDGLEGLETPYGLRFLIGLAFAGSGLYAWARRPENRLGPLMTAVGCIYLLAQILSQAHASTLFTAGIWISDAWVVVFVAFLLAFPDGRINARFDLVVIGMFALMAFPLELAWLLFWNDRGEPRERAGGLAESRPRGQCRLRAEGSRHVRLRRPRDHIGAALAPCQPATPTSARAHPGRLGRHPPELRAPRSRQVPDRVPAGEVGGPRGLHRDPARRPGRHPPLPACTLDRRRPLRRAPRGSVTDRAP